MLANILCFIFGFLIAQGGDRPRVNRVFVTTPYNASIVYEYANASIREDQPVNDGSLECVRSQFETIDWEKDVDYKAERDSPLLDITIHLKRKKP